MPSLQPCIEGYLYVTGNGNPVGLLLRRTLYTFRSSVIKHPLSESLNADD